MESAFSKRNLEKNVKPYGCLTFSGIRHPCRKLCKKAVLCDLNEAETKKLQVIGNTVKFDIKPFEIVTIKVVL